MNNRAARLIKKACNTRAQERQSKRVYNEMSHTQKADAKAFMADFVMAKEAGVAGVAS